MGRIVLTKGSHVETMYRPDRERLNDSRVYQLLRGSNSLLSEKFFESLSSLVVRSGDIDNLLNVESVILRLGQSRAAMGVLRELTDLLPQIGMEDASTIVSSVFELKPVREITGTIHTVGGGFRLTIRKKKVKELCRQITAKLVSAGKEIIDYEEKLQTLLKTDLKFAERDDAYICDCGALYMGRQRRCALCRGAVGTDARSLPRAPSDVREIVQKAVWLELAVAHLFESNGFDVVIGATCRGFSGNEHELDVVANIRDHCSVQVEVTQGKANLTEMANLLVRKQDFPFQHYALVSLGPADSIVHSFGRYHGIGVFPDFRAHSSKLTEWIGHIPSIHTGHHG